jgi:hypothetical protein
MPLPELPLASSGDVAWTFRMGEGRATVAGCRWFHHWTDQSDRRWLSFGRAGDSYVLRFKRTATFSVSPRTRTITREAASRIPRRTIRHLFLNQVLPLALTRGQRAVLHASAVGDREGVVAFAGRAGSGKSTLCAALSFGTRMLITDDALIVERDRDGFMVVPMYGAVRLWPDSVGELFGGRADHTTVSHYTRKRLVPVPAAARPRDSARLRVVCLLAARDAMRRTRAVEVRELTRRDALIRLTGCSFQLDIQDRGVLRDQFARLSALVERVPVVELSYPWRLSRVRETAGAVMDALAPFQ